MSTRLLRATSLLIACAATTFAGDLTVRLKGTPPVTRKTIRYQCDANGTKLGLPAGPFPVEYINGGGNSLAVLPISGQPLIFANVRSASGARYAAREYIWWEAAGRDVSLRSDLSSDQVESFCKPAP